MIKFLKSFSIIALLIPQISHAVITSFQVEDAEAGVRTEVMISEVTMEDIDWKLEEFKSFLKAPASVPLKFIYAAPSSQFMADNNWGALIEQEEITQRLSEISFSENTSVELPSEWLNFDEGRRPQSEISGALQKQFDNYYKKNYRGKRITLILSRTFVNGTVATIGFMAGGMPMEHAMVIGPLTGLISGGFQLISKQLLQYLETNKYEIKIRKLLGLKPVGLKTSKFLATQLKWASTEFSFLAVLDMARFSLGEIHGMGPGMELMRVGQTVFKSLASQGLVDTSVAKELGPKIREAMLAGDFARAAKFRFRAELIAFSSSMAWAGAAITDMMGLPIGNFIFMGMGSVGGINHLRLVLKDSKGTMRKILTSPMECLKYFRKKVSLEIQHQNSLKLSLS